MSAHAQPTAVRGDLRNVAIVAHVDHGKTTLVDAMLWQTGAFGEHQHVDERAMDSGDLEREKGITILAKNTAVRYTGPSAPTAITINIIDTPATPTSAARSSAGCRWSTAIVLLVDASEGPLPQTRFVLRKALPRKLPVILVVNKVDRPDARITEVVDETYELFLDLLDDDARPGRAGLPGRVRLAPGPAAPRWSSPPTAGCRTAPTSSRCSTRSSSAIPAPTYTEGAPLQAHVTNLDASPFLGRLALCGSTRARSARASRWPGCAATARTQRVKITELLVTEALERVPGESRRTGRHRRHRRHPGDHHRRDPRRPGRTRGRCR